MNIVTVIEISLAAIVVLFFVTQILVPAFRGTALFPLFHREGELERKMTQAKQEARERHMERSVSKQQSKGRK